MQGSKINPFHDTQFNKAEQRTFQASLTCGRSDEAKALFMAAKIKLMNVNCWHLLMGRNDVRFVLYDRENRELMRLVKAGDKVKIDNIHSAPSWAIACNLIDGTDREAARESFELSLAPLLTSGEKNIQPQPLTFNVNRNKNMVTARMHQPFEDSDDARLIVYQKRFIQWHHLVRGLIESE